VENIRAADAKEVGVGNPAEETYCYPNKAIIREARDFVNARTFLTKLTLLSDQIPLNPLPGTGAMPSLAPMTETHRTALTYRYERWRALASGILEAAGSTFLLLIAVR